MLREDISPDKVLFSSVLQGCASVRYLNSGRLLHDQIIQDGFESHMIVGNTLIDLYVKCGSIEEARTVFDRLTIRDIVSWGTMIAGYVQHNYDLAAIELFQSSQERGIELNKVVLLGLLKACGSIRAVNQGQMVQKCLEAMQQHGMRPDDVTFTNILTACSHCGLLEEGRWFFRCMIEDYGIMPSVEHYNCVVELLSRNGCLYAAKDLLRSIPLSPDLIIWVSLLTGCKEYGNRDIGTDCFDQSLEMDPDDASGYMLMARLYTDTNMHIDIPRMLDSVCKSVPDKSEDDLGLIKLRTVFDTQSTQYDFDIDSVKLCQGLNIITRPDIEKAHLSVCG
ncbi:hypothetical protein GOP47_0030979 [Adiantum capillus-veneris]|nr:hypothetical protein GOP47_0030979 [Adiantum capillus-veneris]